MEFEPRFATSTALAAPHGDIVQVGNVRLDYASHALTVEGQQVALTFQEFELLSILLGRPDEVVAHRSLCRALWGSFGRPECKRLSVIVSRLRQKLAASRPYAIEVVRARGYGFVLMR